jgi:hypothetical protein
MRLYHSVGTRSTRVLWTLEEIGVPYEITVLTAEGRRSEQGVIDAESNHTATADDWRVWSVWECVDASAALRGLRLHHAEQPRSDMDAGLTDRQRKTKGVGGVSSATQAEPSALRWPRSVK